LFPRTRDYISKATVGQSYCGCK